MNEEKMKRVLEAVVQQKPLAKNDWPRGHEEWGWLLDRTCNVYQGFGFQNKTLTKSVQAVAKDFWKFVDRVYPEHEESWPDWVKDLAAEFASGDEDDEDKEEKEPTEEEIRNKNIERTQKLRATIEEFQKNCTEEYLMQMPAEELEAWKTLAKIDCHYKIQVWCGYRRETTITSDFVIDDTAVNLIREREWVEETRKHRVAHYFYCYKRI